LKDRQVNRYAREKTCYKVLKIVEEKGPATIKEIAEEVGLSLSRTQNCLKVLEREGKISRILSPRAGRGRARYRVGRIFGGRYDRRHYFYDPSNPTHLIRLENMILSLVSKEELMRGPGFLSALRKVLRNMHVPEKVIDAVIITLQEMKTRKIVEEAREKGFQV